jgi:hypothetical protein
MHPDDQNYVDQQRGRIKELVQAHAFGTYGTHNPNDPSVVKDVDNALSTQRADQILSKAKTDAITAQQWFGKYASDLTNPADMMRVQSAIEGHAATVAAEHVSNTVTNAHRQPDGSFDVSERVMADEARAAAEKALPGNELAGATAVAKLKGFLGNDSWLRTQDEREARDQLNQILQKGDLRDAHQMMLYPDMDKIMAKMPTVRTVDQLQTYMNRFYGSVDKQTNEYWATLINGMRTSDAAAFQYLDPTDPKYHLHKDDIIKIQNQQAAAASNPKNDAKVSQAMTWLLGARGTELNTLKVDRFNKDDPNDYYHFRGAMQEALQEWAEDHKRPPTYEEVVDKIGPQIIKTQAVAKGWIYNTNEPAFRQDMTDQDRQRLTKMFTDKGGAPPDDKQLIRAYAREQFQKFYKQAKPSGSDQPNQ